MSGESGPDLSRDKGFIEYIDRRGEIRVILLCGYVEVIDVLVRRSLAVVMLLHVRASCGAKTRALVSFRRHRKKM